MHPPASLVCATWNLHRGEGHDGRVDPDRTGRAIATDIAPLGPQILALQEADTCAKPHRALIPRARLEETTGLRSLHDAPDMRWGPESGGYLGNILLLDPRLPITGRRIIELPGHAPRAAILAEILVGGTPLRILSCHLALIQALRALQLRQIAQVLDRRAPMQTVLMGDLNEWRPWGGLALAPRNVGLNLHGPPLRSFPAHRPLLPLDRILSDRPGAIQRARVVDTPLIRAASDHLPLTADILLRDERGA